MNVERAIRLAYRVRAKVGERALCRRFVFVGGALRPIVRGIFCPVRAHHRDDVVAGAVKNATPLGLSPNTVSLLPSACTESKETRCQAPNSRSLSASCWLAALSLRAFIAKTVTTTIM